MSHPLFRPVRAIVVLLAASIVAYLGVRLYGPVKGAYWRTFRTPALVRGQSVEDLVGARADVQRRRLFEVWRSARGTYGLRQTVLSVEGTPIGLVLVVERGRATFVFDYTRDAYGTRQFIIEPVQAIEVSASVAHGGVAAGGESSGFGRTRLRCSFDSGKSTWF
jgi:hypothetical protein